jgi:methylmalonyl-CoA mutase cobalamin-binding domain/chain
MVDRELIDALKIAVIEGDDVKATHLAESAMQAKVEALFLVNECIQPALNQIGQQFQSGECYLPELILAGDAAMAVLQVLKSGLTGGTVLGATKGTVVIGTIQGDLHDIGKNVVSALLTANGFQVIDLGTDVSPKKFVETAEEKKAQIIAVSSLLTTTMPFHADVVRLLVDLGKRRDHFVIVGGGPVNAEWAAKINADGYGRDAQDAVQLCQALMEPDRKPPLSQPLCFGSLK